MNRPFNVIAFLVGWTACLWGASSGQPLVGPLVVGVLLAAQSFTMVDPRRTLGLIAVVGILGTGIDSALLAGGLVVIDQPLRGEWLCPFWVTMQWINLGTCMHGWLAWLGGRHGLAALLGAVATPLSYVTADRVGAIKIMASPQLALPTFVLIGAVVLPLVLWLGHLSIYRPRR